MSDFTEFVSTPTVVEVFYWHTYKKKKTQLKINSNLQKSD